MNVSLPHVLYSTTQLSELMHEIEVRLGEQQDQIAQQKVASRVVTDVRPPSAILEETASRNGLNFDKSEDLQSLHAALGAIRTSAPHIKLTVAAWPDMTVKQQLVSWFRTNIHPSLFLTFVVRSDICGGVIVQTPKRRIDLSYRQLLIDNRHKLAELTFHGN